MRRPWLTVLAIGALSLAPPAIAADNSSVLSLLYVVLISLILVEFAVVAWSVNFVRKYAFRSSPDLAHKRGAQERPPHDASRLSR